MHLRTTSILCPKCGAAVSFFEEDRVIRCDHCTMHFIPDHSQGVERYYFKHQIRDPLSQVHRLLLKKGFGRDTYRIVDVDTFFFPVWRGNGQITGWIAGLSPFKTYEYTETVRTPTGGQVTMKQKRQEGGIPLKKLIRIEKDMLFRGVKREDLRWRSEEVMDDAYATFLKVYDQEEMTKWGKIFTPDSAPHIKRKEIKHRFIESVRSMYLGYDPLHDRLKVIGERLYLYYFPLALVKVMLNGKLVFLTVNGITGNISSNVPLEKTTKHMRRKPHPLLDTLIVLLSAILASSLFIIDHNFAKQMAIVILIITLTILWIKK
jgi:hypothetical protein